MNLDKIVNVGRKIATAISIPVIIAGCATTSIPTEKGLEPGIKTTQNKVCATSCLKTTNISIGRTMAEDRARHELFKYFKNVDSNLYSGIFSGARIEQYSQIGQPGSYEVCARACPSTE
jgi:hypothetical protein